MISHDSFGSLAITLLALVNMPSRPEEEDLGQHPPSTFEQRLRSIYLIYGLRPAAVCLKQLAPRHAGISPKPQKLESQIANDNSVTSK